MRFALLRSLVLIALLSAAATICGCATWRADTIDPPRALRHLELGLVQSVTILQPSVEAHRVTSEGSERMPGFEAKLAANLAGQAARSLANKRFEVHAPPLPLSPEEAALMEAELGSLNQAWRETASRLSGGSSIAELSVGPAIRPVAVRTATQTLLLINYSGVTRTGPHSDAAADFALHMAGKLGRLAGTGTRSERLEMALIDAETGAVLWYAMADNNRLSSLGAQEAAFDALRSLPRRPRHLQSKQETVRALQGIRTVAVIPGLSHIADLRDGGRDAKLEAAVAQTLAGSARSLAVEKGFTVDQAVAGQPDALLSIRFTGVRSPSPVADADEQSSFVPALIAVAVVAAIVASKGAGASFPCCGNMDVLPASGVVELTLIDTKTGETVWTGYAPSYRRSADNVVSEAMRTLPAIKRTHAAR